MKKYYIAVITFFYGLYLIFSTSAFAINCAGTKTNPCVVEDAVDNTVKQDAALQDTDSQDTVKQDTDSQDSTKQDNDSQDTESKDTTTPDAAGQDKDTTAKVKNYRNTIEMSKKLGNSKDAINLTGLSTLWESGSAEPSESEWHTILNKTHAATQGKQIEIYDIDLRQENHGYLNGNAIALTDSNNWINSGKNYNEVCSTEKHWLHNLSKQSFIDGVLTRKQMDNKEFSKGQTISIPENSVFSEETLVDKLGITYHRFPLTDHVAPDDLDVDRFVAFVSHLRKNAWLHMHCRDGHGRTTTFMVMYDMLKNADKVSFDDIIKRQATVLDLSKIDESSNPVIIQQNKDRLQFITNFYKFCIDRLQNDYKKNWTHWLRDHNMENGYQQAVSANND